MLFADTSYLLALFVSNDERHGRAVELSRGISEGLVSTDHVLSEFVTIVSKRAGNKAAYLLGSNLLKSEIKIVYIGEETVSSALDFIRRHPGISMCDAISAAIMKEMGVRKILSFDSDFDKMGFERVC
jgi:predicted nucleic acid-binding protein